MATQMWSQKAPTSLGSGPERDNEPRFPDSVYGVTIRVAKLIVDFQRIGAGVRSGFMITMISTIARASELETTDGP